MRKYVRWNGCKVCIDNKFEMNKDILLYVDQFDVSVFHAVLTK